VSGFLALTFDLATWPSSFGFFDLALAWLLISFFLLLSFGLWFLALWLSLD
jgi:hypothetical protein